MTLPSKINSPEFVQTLQTTLMKCFWFLTSAIHSDFGMTPAVYRRLQASVKILTVLVFGRP